MSKNIISDKRKKKPNFISVDLTKTDSKVPLSKINAVINDFVKYGCFDKLLVIPYHILPRECFYLKNRQTKNYPCAKCKLSKSVKCFAHAISEYANLYGYRSFFFVTKEQIEDVISDFSPTIVLGINCLEDIKPIYNAMRHNTEYCPLFDVLPLSSDFGEYNLPNIYETACEFIKNFVKTQ